MPHFSDLHIIITLQGLGPKYLPPMMYPTSSSWRWTRRTPSAQGWTASWTHTPGNTKSLVLWRPNSYMHLVLLLPCFRGPEAFCDWVFTVYFSVFLDLLQNFFPSVNYVLYLPHKYIYLVSTSDSVFFPRGYIFCRNSSIKIIENRYESGKARYNDETNPLTKKLL